MLVILTEQQVLSAKQVCSSCLMADSGGSPRWRKGRLCCGRPIDASRIHTNSQENLSDRVYECQMGFRLKNIR